MSFTKQECGEHFTSRGPKRVPDLDFRQVVSLVGLLSLCVMSVLYGLSQTEGNNRKSSPRRSYKVGDNFERLIELAPTRRGLKLMLIMGQAVYDLGIGNDVIVVVPKNLGLLRSRKAFRSRSLRAIKRLSGREAIVVDYDPRLDDGRIKRFSRSPGLRKYPKRIFVLREPGTDPVKRWAFVSDKKRKRIYLVPLSMVPEARL